MNKVKRQHISAFTEVTKMKSLSQGESGLYILRKGGGREEGKY